MAKRTSSKSSESYAATSTIARPTRGRTRSRAADDQAVSQRAFEIYQERIRTGRDGDAVSDWLQAESEVSAH